MEHNCLQGFTENTFANSIHVIGSILGTSFITLLFCLSTAWLGAALAVKFRQYQEVQKDKQVAKYAHISTEKEN